KIAFISRIQFIPDRLGNNTKHGAAIKFEKTGIDYTQLHGRAGQENGLATLVEWPVSRTTLIIPSQRPLHKTYRSAGGCVLQDRGLTALGLFPGWFSLFQQPSISCLCGRRQAVRG